MAPGCPERFDWQFAKYVWNFPHHHQPRLSKMLDDFDGSKIVLTNPGQVTGSIADVGREA